MTTEEDREGFEAALKLRVLRSKEDFKTTQTDEYCSPYTTLAWEGWQAARDHYAPKMMEITAVDFTAKSIAIADCGQWDSLHEGDEKDVHRGFTCKLYYRYLAKVALRAAGVRFLEEA